MTLRYVVVTLVSLSLSVGASAAGWTDSDQEVTC